MMVWSSVLMVSTFSRTNLAFGCTMSASVLRSCRNLVCLAKTLRWEVVQIGPCRRDGDPSCLLVRFSIEQGNQHRGFKVFDRRFFRNKLNVQSDWAATAAVCLCDLSSRGTVCTTSMAERTTRASNTRACRPGLIDTTAQT